MTVVLTDLDRTLTGPDLVLDAIAIERMSALRERGVRVVIVTGRRLDDVLAIGLTPGADVLVVENGAIVLTRPDWRPRIVGEDWSRNARRALGTLAASFTWGRVIASGPRELAAAATAALDANGVDHSTSFNAEEVMLQPPEVDKAAGARRALEHLGLTPEDAWAIGDGENDVPLIALAGRSAAPANAHPAAKAAAVLSLTTSYSRAFLEFTQPLMRGMEERP